MDVEGCGRLSVHDGFSDVAWFCVCKLVVVVRWWWLGASASASASALGDRRVLCGSCRIRVTSMHYIKSIRMYVCG